MDTQCRPPDARLSSTALHSCSPYCQQCSLQPPTLPPRYTVDVCGLCLPVCICVCFLCMGVMRLYWPYVCLCLNVLYVKVHVCLRPCSRRQCFCVFVHVKLVCLCACTPNISRVRPQRPGLLAAFLHRLCVCVCELGLQDSISTHRNR